MSNINDNGFNTLSPFVALIATIVDEVIAESGVGATAYSALSDKTTANLPSLNGPLAVALGLKADSATAAAHYANTGNPHGATAAQVGAIPAGGLKTINGSSIEGSGDIAVSGVTSLSALTDKTTYDITTVNTPLANALAARAIIPTPGNLGTGALALTSADANRPNRASPTAPQTVTIDTTGCTIGWLWPIANLGVSNITMPSGFVIPPNGFGCDEWEGGSTFVSTVNNSALPAPGVDGNVLTAAGGIWTSAPSSGGSGAVPASISGLAATGSTLTCNPGAGYHGSYQWQNYVSSAWSDVAGATSSTFVTVLTATPYRCNFGGIYYTNSITTTGTPAKITFTDPFSSTLDARWSQSVAGWATGSGVLTFSGASYSSIYANCTAGDNSLSADWVIVGGSSYAALCIRYVDDNNCVHVFRDAGNGDKLTLRALVAGTPAGAVAEASASSFVGGGNTIRIRSVGNLITVSVAGTDVVSGTFTQFASATKVAMSINSGHSSDTMDNAVLA